MVSLFKKLDYHTINEQYYLLALTASYLYYYDLSFQCEHKLLIF